MKVETDGSDGQQVLLREERGGSEDERELHQMLREHVFSRGHPDLAALQDGLAILRDTDLRNELSQIQQPALVIAGDDAEMRQRLTREAG